MSPKTLESRHAIESCTFHLHSWKPFQSKTLTVDSSDYSGLHTKRQCRADRATNIESQLDMSKLSLFDDDRSASKRRCLLAGKRRRRGSRSVSGRSSDRSGTRRRCCSAGPASAAYGTCSDFPIAVGTDSSGELFVSNNSNGDMNWVLDVSSSSEVVVARTPSRKDRERGGVISGDHSNASFVGQVIVGNFNESCLGNESGYGSEPGYRGDAEFGYGDELDEEEEDDQWGDEFGALSKMEKVGENALQKVHHRCRRRKQDCKMVIP